MKAEETERCKACEDLWQNGGFCRGVGDPIHPCVHTVEDGRAVLDWVDKLVRMPKQEDADAQGCVLIWDKLNGVLIAGYRNEHAFGRENVTHWARIPRGPGRRKA